MIPINSHCDFFYIFSSTFLNYDSRFVLLIYMSQLRLGATELFHIFSLGISLTEAPSPHYYLNK